MRIVPRKCVECEPISAVRVRASGTAELLRFAASRKTPASPCVAGGQRAGLFFAANCSHVQIALSATTFALKSKTWPALHFPPISSVVADVRPSVNHSERVGNQRPSMIVLHYTGMPSANAALDLLCSGGSQVSAHYFVFEDGSIIQLVPESRRAWHAGSAFWAGETDINSCSIGIEIANPGHEHGYLDFPKRQIAATTALCRSILTRNTVPPLRVLAHSDIAPARKQDPGEKFPWRTLYDRRRTLGAAGADFREQCVGRAR